MGWMKLIFRFALDMIELRWGVQVNFELKVVPRYLILSDQGMGVLLIVICGNGRGWYFQVKMID